MADAQGPAQRQPKSRGPEPATKQGRCWHREGPPDGWANYCMARERASSLQCEEYEASWDVAQQVYLLGISACPDAKSADPERLIESTVTPISGGIWAVAQVGETGSVDACWCMVSSSTQSLEFHQASNLQRAANSGRWRHELRCIVGVLPDLKP
eukprot:359062-Chlamydomonas_euryale.AAC.19